VLVRARGRKPLFSTPAVSYPLAVRPGSSARDNRRVPRATTFGARPRGVSAPPGPLMNRAVTVPLLAAPANPNPAESNAIRGYRTENCN
jgi:hypothetical protein